MSVFERKGFLLWGAILIVTCGISGWIGPQVRFSPLDLAHELLFPPPVEGQRPPGALPLESSRVLVVDVSVDPREGFPIADRGTLAKVIDKLTELEAWSIGVDVLFENRRDPASDQALERAIRSSGRVVLATRYESSTLSEIQPIWSSLARSLGIANIIVDKDGYCRMVQHYYHQTGIHTRFSLSLETCRVLLSGPGASLPPVAVDAHELTFQGVNGERVRVPFDERGMSLIQYQGPAVTVPQIHWTDLLRLDRKRLDLSRRAVFVGDARLRTGDARLTPFHRGALSQIAGVEIHAHNLLGMITGPCRYTAGSSTIWGTTVVGVLIGAVLARSFSLPWVILGVPLVISVGFVAACVTFIQFGLFVNPVPFSLAVGISAAGTVVCLLKWLIPAGAIELPRTARRKLDQALDLLRREQPAQAVDCLQSIVHPDAAPAHPTIRWAMAKAFLASGQIPLALSQVKDLPMGGLPLDWIYDLAGSLEEAGALAEAEEAFRQILVRKLSYRDSAARAKTLAARDPRVPDGLIRALVHRYREVTFLAEGGMGKVYRAHDRVRNEHVAIKVPDPTLLAQADVKRRFLREIQLLSRLSHPHIVKLLDVGREELLYYSMELVSGRSLKVLVQSEGQLSVDRTMKLLLPIAEALAASHREGVIHRDVKPENILVDLDDFPRLTDFGLAFIEDQTRVTRTGINVGTPAFMAPELLTGLDPTPSADIFSLGVVFYEALTGALPFGANPVLGRLMNEFVPLRVRAPKVSATLDRLITICLDKDPERRPQNGTDLVNRLVEIRTPGS